MTDNFPLIALLGGALIGNDAYVRGGGMKYKILLQQSEKVLASRAQGCLDAGRRGQPSKRPSRTFETPVRNMWQP